MIANYTLNAGVNRGLSNIYLWITLCTHFKTTGITVTKRHVNVKSFYISTACNKKRQEEFILIFNLLWITFWKNVETEAAFIIVFRQGGVTLSRSEIFKSIICVFRYR